MGTFFIGVLIDVSMFRCFVLMNIFHYTEVLVILFTMGSESRRRRPAQLEEYFSIWQALINNTQGNCFYKWGFSFTKDILL